MKKYFVKWFTCDDPIKTGLFVFIHSKNLYDPYVQCKDVKQARMWSSLGYKVAKLELCERELIVDTFITFKGSDKPYLATGRTPKAMLIQKGSVDNFAVDPVAYYPHNPIRLGKISNKAVWVKAFDEFSQKEVRADKKGVYQILCPSCKKFH